MITIILSVLLGVSIVGNVFLYLAFRNVKFYSNSLEVELVRMVMKSQEKTLSKTENALLDGLNNELGKFTSGRRR